MHCSQTPTRFLFQLLSFEIPTNMHCSQTLHEAIFHIRQFEIPTNMHCSQTRSLRLGNINVFEIPTNMHCSQTTLICSRHYNSLRYLQICTALKLEDFVLVNSIRLRYLQICTALKPLTRLEITLDSLRYLQICTALKRVFGCTENRICLRYLQICTALKPQIIIQDIMSCSHPIAVHIFIYANISQRSLSIIYIFSFICLSCIYDSMHNTSISCFIHVSKNKKASLSLIKLLKL